VRPRRSQGKGRVIRTPLVVDGPPRVEILGVHSLPSPYDETLLVEVIVSAPSQMFSISDFEAPSEIQEEERDCGQQEFWLSRDGTRLLGFAWEHPDFPAPTRVAFLLHACRVPFTLSTPGGKVHIRRATPIPERLLRLIWVEDLG
jgi:hypothetical protein